MDVRAGLHAADLDALAALERRVVAADGGRLKLEWPKLRARPAGAVHDLLAWDGGRLIGFAGLYGFGDGPVEIAGAVDPARRRRGVGSALLRAAFGLLAARGADAALLVCPRTAAGGVLFAARHGGVPSHAEHALVLDGEPAPGPADPALVLRSAWHADAPALIALLRAQYGGHPVLDPDDGAGHTVVERDGAVVGYLRLGRDGPTGTVHGFVVRADLRGRGIGRDALRRACRQLRADGATAVALEVAVDNDRALGLYTSLGFVPVVTEDYVRVTRRAGAGGAADGG